MFKIDVGDTIDLTSTKRVDGRMIQTRESGKVLSSSHNGPIVLYLITVETGLLVVYFDEDGSLRVLSKTLVDPSKTQQVADLAAKMGFHI